MTAVAEAYESDYEFAELFDEMELTEEAVRGRFRPAKKVFFPGALSSATLHTPKGPATLNLPSPVPTLTQFRSLEQTVNGTSARLNAVQTALARITREWARGAATRRANRHDDDDVYAARPEEAARRPGGSYAYRLGCQSRVADDQQQQLLDVHPAVHPADAAKRLRRIGSGPG